jgi:hypothetical protein
MYPLVKGLASSKFIGREGTIPRSDRSLELKLSLASASRATDRVTVLYSSPVTVEVDGVDTVSDIQRFSCEFVLAETVGSETREDFVAEVASLISSALMLAYVKDRDPAY